MGCERKHMERVYFEETGTTQRAGRRVSVLPHASSPHKYIYCTVAVQSSLVHIFSCPFAVRCTLEGRGE